MLRHQQKLGHFFIQSVRVGFSFLVVTRHFRAPSFPPGEEEKVKVRGDKKEIKQTQWQLVLLAHLSQIDCGKFPRTVVLATCRYRRQPQMRSAGVVCSSGARLEPILLKQTTRRAFCKANPESFIIASASAVKRTVFRCICLH